MPVFDRIPFGKVLIALAIAVVGWAIWLTSYRPWDVRTYFKEDGFIEVFPAPLYLVVAIGIAAFPYFRRGYKWTIAVICVLMGAREWDIHERITQGDFLFFPPAFKANHPYLYAALETTAVSFAVGLLLVMFYVYRNVVRRNLQHRDPHQYMMIAGWLAVGVSISLDGLARKLADTFDYDLPARMGMFSTVLEETAEFFIPICFLFGLLAFHQARRAGKYDPADPTYEIG
jgi:hypothetical protein